VRYTSLSLHCLVQHGPLRIGTWLLGTDSQPVLVFQPRSTVVPVPTVCFGRQPCHAISGIPLKLRTSRFPCYCRTTSIDSCRLRPTFRQTSRYLKTGMVSGPPCWLRADRCDSRCQKVDFLAQMQFFRPLQDPGKPLPTQIRSVVAAVHLGAHQCCGSHSPGPRPGAW